MITVSLDKFFEHLRKISPIVITAAIVSGAILFTPVSIKEKLFLLDIPSELLRIFAIIFLFSIFLTLLLLIEAAIRLIKKKFKPKITVRKRKAHYSKLSKIQKEIILQALQSPNSYVCLEMTDGNAQYLMQSGYLYRPNQSVGVDFETSELVAKYVPHPWLIEEYNKNPRFFVEKRG